MIRAGAIAGLLFAAPAAADGIALGLPIDCTLGETCFIQNYVDRDPGEGARDHACGPLAYDGHKGTDFALPSIAAMQAGMDVLAAAPGTVAGRRDALPDIAADAPGAPSLDGQDCGNGVLLRHADGWETQYCHMKRGSIRVTDGQAVEAGEVLGQVGLSGRTEFPHLHLALRRYGAVVDPFAPETSDTCAAEGAETLWATPVAYRPGGLVAIGLAAAVPEFAEVLAGPAPLGAASPETPALVVWAHVFGARAGDRLRLTLAGPAGPVFDEDIALEKTQARLYRAVGRKRPAGGWPAGDYAADVQFTRGDTMLGTRRQTFQVKP